MRQLTSKQKKLIRKWFEESVKEAPYISKAEYDLKSADDLTVEQWDILKAINDTEILYQNINCFLDDLHEIELEKMLK